MVTAFFSDERCFWHGGGNYAFLLPVGGLVQPLAGGLPENPETKRRLKNLVEVTGLMRDLAAQTADPAGWDDLRRVHPEHYLSAFKAMSDAGGGELGLRTPFGRGGFEIAARSAGLAKGALFQVLAGRARNAYALSRPPGHHCLPDWPNGFCLLLTQAEAQTAGATWRGAGTTCADGNGDGSADACARLGDLNGDGRVSGADLGILLGDWGSALQRSDLNRDGTVNGSDLGLLLGEWSP
jgi:hypothetical protein